LGRGVEADEQVEVHEAAALVFSDLDVLDRHLPPHTSFGDAEQAGERAANLYGRAPPQLRSRRVPQHRPGVVPAIQTQRLPDLGVVLVMPAGAGDPAAVLAAAVLLVTASTAQVWPGAVHEAEAGRGQGHEQHRMTGHRRWDAFAADQPGQHELERVVLVQPRARLAPRSASIVAPGVLHPIWQRRGRIQRLDLARELVHGLNAAA
jgi:hypothetical protein